MASSRLKKGAAITGVAVALIGGFEGLRTSAYIPIPGDVPTICFGSTKGVRMGDKKTVDECKALLGEELNTFETRMVACIRDPSKVPDNAYVAFLSFSYNVGTGAFCKSTLNRKLNAGDIRGACNELLRWNRAGGIVWAGLTRRRNEERALCLKGL